MGKKKKREVGQHHGDLRRALLTAALELIEEGTSSPSLRQVTRRAGVSPGAPYHHFDGHDDLMAAVAIEGFDALGVELTSFEHLEKPGEKLRAMTTRYVTFAFEHAAHYHTMFQPSLDAAPEALRAQARETFSMLVGAIVATRPDLSTEVHLELARQSWALAHGAVLIGLDGMFTELGGSSDPAEIASEVSASIVTLVLARPSPEQ